MKILLDIKDESFSFEDGTKASFYFVHQFLNASPGTLIEVKGKDDHGQTVLHAYPPGSHRVVTR